MPGKLAFFVATFGVALFLTLFVPLLSGVFAPRDLPAAAVRGAALWRNFDCAGCHTIVGAGGLYASDLTHTYAGRGDAYLRAFLANPGVFHSGADRVMPRINLTAAEIDDLLAFLNWIDQAVTAFPPRPIHADQPASAPTNLYTFLNWIDQVVITFPPRPIHADQPASVPTNPVSDISAFLRAPDGAA